MSVKEAAQNVGSLSNTRFDGGPGVLKHPDFITLRAMPSLSIFLLCSFRNWRMDDGDERVYSVPLSQLGIKPVYSAPFRQLGRCLFIRNYT